YDSNTMTATTYGDTWEWDGDTWARLTPANPPAPRVAGSMAYHAASGQVMMFGGAVDANAYVPVAAETWLWNGTAWAKQVGPQPPARARAMMAPDPVRGVVVLFGGGGN